MIRFTISSAVVAAGLFVVTMNPDSACAAESSEATFTTEQLEFFETKIRPLLVERCFSCHSAKAEKLKAGLYMDGRAALLKGGESGAAIVPGKPDESLIMQAVRYESYEMPPDGKLRDEEIASLAKWVEMGAPWPAGQPASLPTANATDYDWAELRDGHWAWKPVSRPEIPTSDKSSRWSQNGIDHFVFRQLNEAGLPPSDPARSEILVRRLFLDLTGLPPTPEQVNSFKDAVTTDRKAAIAATIDQLLQSPHYGERWGRHWLDVARYSDGFGGFLDSSGLPEAWRYRDWVVNAFNSDMPYDEFVRLQIAGDLLSNSPESAIATGFFALGPTYRSDGGDPEAVAQAKSETLDDRLDTLSRGFMAITVACARCHDHKFDPIPHKDYYSLAGVFNNSAVNQFPLADDVVVRAYRDAQKVINDQQKMINDLKNLAKKEKRKLTGEEQKQIDGWNKTLAELKMAAPPMYETAHTLRDSGSGGMKIALRGDLRKPGDVAPRRFLRLLSSDDPARFTKGSGRLELADAVASEDNPLTARVIVNRIWQHHFGKALVRSPSNFGTLGQKPTHPELLDWLASEFVESGWSIKSLHRLILTSASWQQSSQIRDDGFNRDGDNRLIWRMNPRRMDAESWRDSQLFVTGELDETSGGRPIDNITASSRRTIYAKVSRNGDRFASDSFLRLFDFPQMRATVAERPSTIVPQQYLFMMNSDFMVARARALVASISAGDPDSEGEKISKAYQLLYGRNATAAETAIGLQYLTQSPKVAHSSRPTPEPAKAGTDLLIADFEGTNYGKWKTDGAAFGKEPAQGTIGGQMVVSGFLGNGLVNSFLPNDAPTGRLTSPAFTIDRKFIRFLIGGGGYAGKTCMNLLVDGKPVRTVVGPNVVGGGSEALAWKHWDVSDLVEKRATLEVVDNHSGGWGHINVDHIFQSNLSDGDVPGSPKRDTSPNAEIPRWVQYAQVLLSSNEFMFVR
ncbi:MAG: mono/diheme cytochrome c family protein [Planctomycetaceae bacterium]|jgi:mono/diheme cytochrome c family protein